MNLDTFLHLIKYNLIFNKVRIAFLTVLSFIIYGLTTYFFETHKGAAEAMMQYSFYVMFMIFTGKMNARNNLMFDIKHLLALPLSKYEIIFLKSIADIVQLIPIASVFLYGFSISFPDFHFLFIVILFLMALTLANIIAFNKRVDFSRMQHSQASFKNSFLYFHKYLEMFIQIILAVFSIGMVLVVFEKNIMLREYGFLILLIVAVFLATQSSLKMLKDETRSYFVFRRDAFRIGWKVLVVAIPLLIFDHIYKDKSFLKEHFKQSDPIVQKLKNKIEEIENITDKKFLLALVQNDEKSIAGYLKDPESIPWEAEIMGSYAPHLSVNMGKLDLLKQFVAIKPDIINMEGKYRKRTPIFSAVKRCHMEVLEYLIENKVDINHKDNTGMTPILFAAQNKCLGGVILLSSNGADLDVKDKLNQDIYYYLGNRSGLSYLLRKKHAKKPQRELASEKIEDSTFVGPVKPHESL